MTDDRHLLTDLAVVVRHQSFRPVYDVVATEARRRNGTRTGIVEDLGTITGRANLGQALVLRLLTPLGELASLGHPEYGSRIPELVGRPNTATTRDLLKLAIIDSVVREPRVAEVAEVSVDPAVAQRDRVDVVVVVVPVGPDHEHGGGAHSPVRVGPITLELGS